jgi:uncharacterized protein YcbX
MHSELRVSALFVHPLKSASGMRVAEARIDALGFAGDRRWMAVDAEGGFLSQRRIPRMALIRATLLSPGDLYLSAPGIASIRVPRPGDTAEDRQVTIWTDDVRALDSGDKAAVWLTTVLGCEARLVYCPPSRARVVDRAFASGAELVGFADGFPLLILGESSLQDINARLRQLGESEIGLERFRPNIVIEGAAPFEEDEWRQIVIGDGADAITVDVVKPCARCSIPSVDPRTGVQGIEPTRTLSTYRRRDHQVYVGQNALPRGEGRIVTGASVTVVRRG